MSYWGKVVGTVAGLATGRPLMALLGLFLGHQFDRGFADRFSKLGRDAAAERLDLISEGFVFSLFGVMGHLAKADGRVSEEEIRAARAIMHRFGLGPVEVRKAIDRFEAGKRPAFPLIATLRDLRAKDARKQESRALFLRLLLEMALAKRTLHQRERAVLWTVCTELDIGRAEFAQLEAMLRAQRSFRNSTAGDADARRVRDAYTLLGVEKSSTDAEVKKAYRRLMNKYHPDKLAGQNPDAAVVTETERKTREIRSAYELLKSRRRIR